MSSIGDDDDAALAGRAAAGDDRAFSELMRRHKGRLYRFVRPYVGEPDGALEVVQETFVSAWKAIARFDARRPFPVWLRAIALNKCRDRARRQAVRRLVFAERSATSPEAEAQPDPGPNAEAAMAAAQRRDQLAGAIASLPARLKEPLLLTYFEGLSQQETAGLLGVSVKAVETRVYRARQKLAELMSETPN